jgi:hypothetical protein
LIEKKIEYVDDFYDTSIDGFLAGIATSSGNKVQPNDKGKNYV